ARIVGIRGRGRRESTVEIFVAREFLTDQRGADHLAVDFDQAALRLFWEDCFGNPRHCQRIDETGDQSENHHEHDRWADFSQHDVTPQARCKAATTRSMALMPMNGTMTPPSP